MRPPLSGSKSVPWQASVRRPLNYAATYVVSIVIILAVTGAVAAIRHLINIPGRAVPAGCWFDPYNGPQCDPTCEDLREAGIYPADSPCKD